MSHSSANRSEIKRLRVASGQPTIRLGFVPLNDSAPLIVAQELGFFARQGLRVHLSRELGWASVRNKLVYGELEGAHAPCGLPPALSLGLDDRPSSCSTGLVLNLNGNAITLARRFHEEGVRTAEDLAQWVTRRRGGPIILGTVSTYSTHSRLIRGWLGSANMVEGRDYQLVIVPPKQILKGLSSGHLDGYCVGEPWNSEAVLRGLGSCLATSCSVASRHPEKVLAVRGDWAMAEPEQHERLVAAVLEACRFCDRPESADTVIELLTRPEYLHLSAEFIRPAWTGRVPISEGQTSRLPEFNCFHRFDANEPTPEKAEWILRELYGDHPGRPLRPDWIKSVFRMDVYEAARSRLSLSKSPLKPTRHVYEPHTLSA